MNSVRLGVCVTFTLPTPTLTYLIYPKLPICRPAGAEEEGSSVKNIAQLESSPPV
jgi:hypothetical protein